MERPLEIALDVSLVGSIAVHVDRKEWNASTFEEKRAIVWEAVRGADYFLSSDIIPFQEGNLSLQIVLPMTEAEIDPAKFEVYDPNA